MQKKVVKRKKNKKDLRHRKNKFKMADINLTISVITLNVNGLCNSSLNERKMTPWPPCLIWLPTTQPQNLPQKINLLSDGE